MERMISADICCGTIKLPKTANWEEKELRGIPHRILYVKNMEISEPSLGVRLESHCSLQQAAAAHGGGTDVTRGVLMTCHFDSSTLRVTNQLKSNGNVSQSVFLTRGP